MDKRRKERLRQRVKNRKKQRDTKYIKTRDPRQIVSLIAPELDIHDIKSISEWSVTSYEIRERMQSIEVKNKIHEIYGNDKAFPNEPLRVFRRVMLESFRPVRGKQVPYENKTCMLYKVDIEWMISLTQFWMPETIYWDFKQRVP